MNVETNGRKFKDDRVVNLINSAFISLKDEDMKRNNEILHPVINEVIKVLKDNNEFFKDHYRNIMFVGSYYKGTKVGKPEEFDLNLIIQLPLNYESIKFESEVPGYTKLKLSNDSYKPGWERHNKILSKWVTPEGYLNQELFRQYMESSLGNAPKSVTVGDNTYVLNLRKSGPAFTLCVKGFDSLEMSVDLVPVLEFKTQPPVPGDFKTASWFVVPKSKRDLTESHLYWRMSFYGFEKAMLKRNGSLKPVIRQMKKLRDTADWKLIASYHIETLSLHRIKVMESKPELQKCSMTEHFVEMLGQLKEACETNKIVNFWDKSHNLIEDVKPAQLAGIKGRLEKIIKQIEKDPFTIADYVLTKEERSSIEPELNGYRNPIKVSKSVDQVPVKANEVKLMQSKSCNMTPSNESGSLIEGCLKFFQTSSLTINDKVPIVDATKEKEEKAEISVAVTKKKVPNSTVDETKSSSTNIAEKNDGFAEIMNMLKLIQSDMADTKNAVNLLTRRVAAVEDKVDILLSRSYSNVKEETIPMLSSPGFLRGFDDLVSRGPLLN